MDCAYEVTIKPNYKRMKEYLGKKGQSCRKTNKNEHKNEEKEHKDKNLIMKKKRGKIEKSATFVTQDKYVIEFEYNNKNVLFESDNEYNIFEYENKDEDMTVDKSIIVVSQQSVSYHQNMILLLLMNITRNTELRRTLVRT